MRAGLARDVIRLIQEARKNTGLDVSDRVVVVWQAGGETAEALREHAALVSEEVLATEMREGDPVPEPAPAADGTRSGALVRDDDLGLTVSVTRV